MIAYVYNGILNLENQVSENEEIKLFNASGQLILSQDSLPQQCTVSLQNYPKGIYVLEVTSGAENYRVKLKL